MRNSKNLLLPQGRNLGFTKLSDLLGNYHRYRFPRVKFDMILMSHILHNEGAPEARRLIRQAYRALLPGGRIAIHDFCLGEKVPNPLFCAVYSVYMTILTHQGSAHKIHDLIRWMNEAGFAQAECRPICADRPNATQLITGVKL